VGLSKGSVQFRQII